MLFRVVVLLVCLTGCAEMTQPPVQPTRAVAMNRTAPPRTLRVIGTAKDMELGGQQYCGGNYTLKFTSWDKTEGLITCK